MWIFTSAGFVSAVEHRDDKNLLMVRGRDKESLMTMLSGIELAGKAADEDYGVDAMTIYSETGSDYPWRVVVSKATFAIWMQFEIMNYLNYHNFKNALAENKGDKWKKAAMNVWTDMLAVEDKPRHWRPYSALADDELNNLLVAEGVIDAEHDYRDMSETELEDIHAQLVHMNSQSVAPREDPSVMTDLGEIPDPYEGDAYDLAYRDGKLVSYEDAADQLFGADELPEDHLETALYADRTIGNDDMDDWHYSETKGEYRGYGGF